VSIVACLPEKIAMRFKLVSGSESLFGIAFLFALVFGRFSFGEEAKDPAPASETAPAPSLAASQEAIEMRYRRFEGTLLQLSEYLRKTDPARAELLLRASGKSKEVRIPDQLQNLTELLKKDQLGDAVERQELVVAELQSLLELLMSEARKDDLEKEKQRIQDLIKDVNKLISKESDARANTERGGNNSDLQNQQKQVADSTKKLVDKIESQDAAKKAGKSDSKSESSRKPSSDKKDGEKKDGDNKDGTEPKDGDASDPESDPKDSDSQKDDGSPSGDDKGKPADSQQKSGGDKKPSDGKSGEDKESKPKDGDKQSEGDPEDQKSGEKPDENGKPDEKDSSKEDSKQSPSSGKPKSGKPQSSKPKSGKPQEGKSQEGEQPQEQQDEGQQDQDQEEQAPQEDSGSQKKADKTPGREELERAKQEMDRAIEELKRNNRKGASDKQDKAISELMKAKEKLEEILRQLREEERELVLAQLEARFRDMLLKQEAVNNATLAIHAVTEESRTDRHRNRSVELARNEEEISLLAAKALTLLKEEGSSVAFPEAIEQIREDMLTVARRLERVDVGEITQNIEQDIVEGLKEIIEALQKELEKMKDKKQQQQQQQEQQQQQQQQGLVNKLAELKMLRSLQYRVNRRTKQLGRLVDGEQAVDADVIGQLKQLSDRQAKVQKATYDLSTGKNQ
jgi:hypothetical protein